MKHHLGGGKASVGFGLDQIRTLVSMATESSHRVIMGKQRHHVFSNAFDQILFILAGNDDMHESLNEFKIRPDATTGFHGNRKGNSGKYGVITFSQTFLIGFISYLQVTMIYIRA